MFNQNIYDISFLKLSHADLCLTYLTAVCSAQVKTLLIGVRSRAMIGIDFMMDISLRTLPVDLIDNGVNQPCHVKVR